MTEFKNTSYTIISFKCHGFKCSICVILDETIHNKYMFVCETCLKSYELSANTFELTKMNYWCSLKSKVDPVVVL